MRSGHFTSWDDWGFVFGDAAVEQNSSGRNKKDKGGHHYAVPKGAGQSYRDISGLDVNAKAYAVSEILRTLYSNVLIVVSRGDNSRVWICEVHDGKLTDASDMVLDLNNDKDKYRYQDIMLEAKQILAENQVLTFGSEGDFCIHLVNSCETWSKKQWIKCEIVEKAPRQKFPLGKYVKLAVMCSALTAGLLFHFYEPENNVSDGEKSRIEMAQADLRAARSSMLSEIPMDQAMQFIADALTVPYSMKGFRLSSVSCQRNACTYTYSNFEAPLVSPARDVALTLAGDVAVTDGGDKITFSRHINTSHDARLVSAHKDKIGVAWLDLKTTVEDTGASLKLSGLSPAPGAVILRDGLHKGDWQLTNAPVKYAMAIIEGLNKLPGVRFNQINIIGTKFQIGGSYAAR